MTTHAILIQSKTAAMDNSYLNRSAIAAVDLDNGNVVSLLDQNEVAGQTELWDCVQPATGSLIGLWMVAAPELVVTVSGTNKYRGIDPDVRNFYTSASTAFDAFKPMVGDKITLTADALDSATPQAFAIATNGSWKLTWAANLGAGVATGLRYIRTSYISIGTGALDNQRVTAFEFEVVVN